jgi:hypothetical protein
MTGFVSEIHGKGGTEVSGYPLTRNELEVLAKYHIREYYDISLTQFEVGGACNTDYRRRAFANLRLERIEQLIGTEPIQKFWAEIEEEWREKFGDELWQRFNDGQDLGGCSGDPVNEAEDDRVEKQAKVYLEAAFERLKVNPSGVHLDEAGGLWCLVRGYDREDGLREKLVLQYSTIHGGGSYRPPFTAHYVFWKRTLDMPPGWVPIHVSQHVSQLWFTPEKDERTTAEKAFAYLKDNPRSVFYGEDGSRWSLVKGPSEDDWGADKLTLRVESPDGTSRMEPSYSIDVPNRAEPEDFPDIPQRDKAEDW